MHYQLPGNNCQYQEEHCSGYKSTVSKLKHHVTGGKNGMIPASIGSIRHWQSWEEK